MSQAIAALKSARVYLNDINAINWSDSVLMPILQEAYRELIQELDLNSIGVIKVQTQPMLVPAGSRTLPGQPTNILEPISMQENSPQSDVSFYQDMVKVNFLPQIDQDEDLNFWAWLGETIQFIGALTDRNVILRYKGSLAIPNITTDPLGITYAETFLGPRIASIAMSTIGRDNKVIEGIAGINKYKIIQRAVLQNQVPVSRKGYRSSKGVFTQVGISSPVTYPGQTGFSNNVTWILTITPPDGARTQFSFPAIPRFISYNGINQTINIGYLLIAVAGNAFITFRDVLGNILTPGIGDTIVGWKNGVQVTMNTPPDGIRTQFTFSTPPDYIVWNGLNQFIGTGYNQVLVTTNIISLIDALGNIITPDALDDIREAI